MGGHHAMGWELIERRVKTSASTSELFSNTDTTNNEYLIIFQHYNSAGSSTNMKLEFNADGTVTNYHRQVQTANAGVVNGARVNDNTIWACAVGTCTIAEVFIVQDPAHDGYVRAMVRSNNEDPAAVFSQTNALAWVTAGPATSIGITATVATSIGIGSIISLYRLKR